MKRSKLKSMKFLVTCGATWVPIDDVRVISNISSGEMGQLITLELIKKGAKVTLLMGPVTVRLDLKGVQILNYKFFDEISSLLKKELKKGYDFIIHAAAVSDYKLKSAYTGKIDSKKKSLRLELIPSEKIINSIKKISPGSRLVGFKLEEALTSATAKFKAKGLIKQSGCDLVVANSFTKGEYRGFIIDRNSVILSEQYNKKNLAKELVKALERT
ncbi:MAG: hypothetical protein HQL27_02160 [Candidatus Omnitrophica bacterium]|nr:hypothetical protein [Candidatus Omnitrophota bacterium]